MGAIYNAHTFADYFNNCLMEFSIPETFRIVDQSELIKSLS